MITGTLPHEDEIITMLRSLWTPARIVRYLRFRYGDEGVTPADIKKVKDGMAQAAFLTPSKLAARGDVQVDTLMAMSRLLLEQEEQVSAAVIAAEQGGADPGARRIASILIKQYWNMLTEFAEIMQSVGELPKVGAPTDGAERPSALQQTVVLLGELRPKEVGERRPAQALASPLVEAWDAGVIEGDYEEVERKPEGVGVEHSTRALPGRGD